MSAISRMQNTRVFYLKLFRNIFREKEREKEFIETGEKNNNRGSFSRKSLAPKLIATQYYALSLRSAGLLLSNVARYSGCLNYSLSHRYAGLSVLDSPRMAIRRLRRERAYLRSCPSSPPLLVPLSLSLSTCPPRECECPQNLSQFVVLLSRFGNSRLALLFRGEEERKGS